ncbi:PilN domain-containing protein [Candidatus Daviesbacteria bacterium]|nr:PilN domain-containing protein [Candidatus Daviesbacteria bacterium]
MPKPKNPKLTIRLNLLKPQSNPEKLFVKLIKWLLSTGRFIFIFVEALVLLAFIARFKLDADIASTKEDIEQQIPYIESLKPFEILIRQTQLKLSTINSFYVNYPDYSQVMKKVADQTPAGVKIGNLSLEKNINKTTIRLSGVAQNNTDLSVFVGGLKQDQLFVDTTITSIGFEKGNISFSLSFSAKLTKKEGKSL